MHALTVKQPYAELIVCRKKSIEIRTWWPRVQLPMLVAIHAGKTPDMGPRDLWKMAGFDLGIAVTSVAEREEALRLGGIIGVARLAGRIGFGKRGWSELSLMVGRREWGEMASKHLNPVDSWKLGLIGWRFEAPVRFPDLIPCRGKQGLWTLPDDVAGKVERALARAGSGEGYAR